MCVFCKGFPENMFYICSFFENNKTHQVNHRSILGQWEQLSINGLLARHNCCHVRSFNQSEMQKSRQDV